MSRYYSGYYNNHYSNYYSNNYSNYNYKPTTPTFNYIASVNRDNASAGDLVAKVRSYDRDGDVITYKLSDYASKYYSINQYSGDIYLTAYGANCIKTGKYVPEITVFASDGQTISNTASREISFSTNYVNHAPEAPEFTHTANGFVKGKASTGDFVAKVHATDVDGDNVTYYLVSDNRSYVETGAYRIDPKTGNITLTAKGAALVNAGHDLPDVKVISYDGQRTSTIKTLDVADTTYSHVNHAPEAPEFTHTANDFVKGKASTGDFVAKVHATDVDGDNVTYYLVSGNKSYVETGAYRIDPKTGDITLTAKGASLVNAGYDLPDVKVISYDGQRTSTIKTLDVADTTADTTYSHVNHAPDAPDFTYVTDNFVQGKASAGDLVAKVHATDVDGDNVTYYLVSGNQSYVQYDTYKIDPKTGDITLTAKGAALVNAGHDLPDIKVISYDGQRTSTIKTLEIAETSNSGDTTVTETNPTPTESANEHFKVDTTFHDSRDLSEVDLPYFIKILESGKNGYQWKTWGDYGEGATITYEFATSASDRGRGYSFTVKGFQKYSEHQKDAVREALKLYEDQTNLKFVEKSPWSNAKANFKFYLDDLTVDNVYANNHLSKDGEDSTDNSSVLGCTCSVCAQAHANNGDGAAAGGAITLGFAYYGGDVHINSTIYGGETSMDKNTPIVVTRSSNGGYSWMLGGFGTVAHEIGHSIGLSHPFDGDHSIKQYSPEDKCSLTIMSYNRDSKEYVRLPSGQTVYTRVPETKLGIFDLATVHYRYGVNEKQHAGDTVYTFKDFNPKTEGNDIYIWDGSGNDTFDASKETMNVYVNLTPGSWIYRGNKTDHLVYDRNGNLVENQMFIGFGTQIENLKGGRGHDVLIGNETNNHIEGGAGNDRIYGGKGHDWLEGNSGNDILVGGDGNDILDGGTGADSMDGGSGNDIYYVDNEKDSITDSSGIDTVNSTISYQLENSLENLNLLGNDNINAIGNSKSNILIGNDGDNTIDGGSGNDIINGGNGNDILIGGKGSDTFVFNSSLNDDSNVDTIQDFNMKEGDVIQLDSNIFTNLIKGSLNSANFVYGEAANDSNDYIIYNSNTNTLYYDADGNGAGKAVAFARFSDSFDDQITASSFQIV